MKLVFLTGLLITNWISAVAQEKPQYYWYYYVVDSDSPIGGSTALVFDSQDRPTIAYRGTEGRSILKFARFDGESWEITRVDPAGAKRVALALDRSDNPHIVYHHRFLCRTQICDSRWDGLDFEYP